MTEFLIRLDCTNCGTFREFDRERGKDAVKCAVCGKRHSSDSLHALDPSEVPEG